MRQLDPVAEINSWYAASPEERHTARPVVVEHLRAAGFQFPEAMLAGDPTPASCAVPTSIRTLAEIIADPTALAPPTPVVPRLAWAGRVTLLAAREKDGKSTIATAACAAVSCGQPWLGDETPFGRVLWVGLEEHRDDLARRMLDWRADPHRVHVMYAIAPGTDPLTSIHEHSIRIRPTLLVIDTLAALVDATGARPDSGSSANWTAIMAAITRIARDANAAILLLHHARKSDGHYRDSTAIGAGVDVIVQMAEGPSPDSRTLKVRSRWPVGDYSVRLVAGDPDAVPPRLARYDLAAGKPSVEARVLAFVDEHPGHSAGEVREAISGKTTDVSAAVKRFLASGVLVNRGTKTAMKLYRAERSPVVVPILKPLGSGEGKTAEENADSAAA